MKNKMLWMVILLFPIYISTQDSTEKPPTGDWVLEQVDLNLLSKNRIFESKMVIHLRRGTRTVVSKSWAVGEQMALTEYLAPAREKGVKMLKLEDRLWVYSPSTDRIIQISGHMLRQSVMGSDLSYEDMMEDPNLSLNYEAEVIEEVDFRERLCWVLELRARTNDLAYQVRKVWVDKELLVPLKEELFAKSGKLLKKTELFDIKNIDNRWYPMRIHFKDMLKQGSGTEFIIESVKFDQPIPDHLFTKASLRR